ncbi:MAG: hypothetical protein M3R17_19980 [Bacteroidota bacterium]|nr:hypothetical protein [Bacteroidota bacterium]
MTRITLFTICVLFFSSVFGQTKIDNVLTAEHVYVPGTKVSLIPPKGFIKAGDFVGFQQSESGSSILVTEIAGPFSEIRAGLTKEALLSKGVVLSKIDSMTINNLPATFIIGLQSARGTTFTKYILAFGTEKETILINGVFPNALQELGAGIKAAMISAFYEADKKINPFDAVDFEIDVTSTKLLLAKGMAGSLIYSMDGALPTKSKDKTTLMVAKSISQADIVDKKLFALNRLKQMPMQIEKIESTNEITIDGISGYEIIAIGREPNREARKVYQVILYSDHSYYILFGTTNDLTMISIEELKLAVKTFKRK